MDGSGGAIYSEVSSGLHLVESIFSGNKAAHGGALYTKGSVNMDSCTLQNNIALTGKGGAFYGSGQSSGAIRRSAFSGNEAEQGPAVFKESGRYSSVRGNHGCGNMAPEGYCNGIYSDGSCSDFRFTCDAPTAGKSRLCWSVVVLSHIAILK